jgi:C4-dicarboxylate-specific signal transduction histidine kinase
MEELGYFLDAMVPKKGSIVGAMVAKMWLLVVAV